MKLSILLAFLSASIVQAAPQLIKVSTDTFTNASSQHQSEVEADNFGYGNTIVAAFQVGRFHNGGSSGIGFSTSTDGGQTWIGGILPSITKFAGGNYDRVSDPTVAYDAAHGVWLISTLPILERPSPEGAAILVSRSKDGIVWENPTVVGEAPAKSFYDKNWTVCDNHVTSPYFGNCYTQWDDASNMKIYMSTSTDGGLTWSDKQTTQQEIGGIGGQPLVQPDGTVVVPVSGPGWSIYLNSFVSKDGGKTWGQEVRVAIQQGHDIVSGLRAPEFLPSADVDANGKIYTVWSDCQFENNCAFNDIVMVTSNDGINWSSMVRIPIDPMGSKIEHIIPGIAADPASTDPDHIHLALTYYWLPNANCTRATCELNVGFISSNDSGKTWSKPVTLASGMRFDWLPTTTQGNMVGDYISTSMINGKAYPVFAVANQPQATSLDQGMYSIKQGLEISEEPGTPVDRLSSDSKGKNITKRKLKPRTLF